MKEEIDSEVLEKCNFFRETRIWPLAETFNVEQWLDNFQDEQEKAIANLIVDFVIFIPEPIINQMFSTVIGKCGSYFRTFEDTWSDDDFLNRCWYSYIPGEDHSAADSGLIFLRKIRNLLGLPDERLLTHEALVKRMYETYAEYFVLVDDFIGSGHQVEEAWCNSYFNNTSIKEICQSHHHRVVYAPLIVNELGYKHVQEVCSGLHLEYIHRLPVEFSLFHPQCPCWKGDAELYKQGIELILQKSAELGIPDTNGMKTNDMRGYRKQGLAIAFQHGIPDACLPIFTVETLNWKPLYKCHN